MSENKQPSSRTVVGFIDFAFLTTFLILIFLGIFKAKTPAVTTLFTPPPQGGLFLVGLGGLCILFASKISQAEFLGRVKGVPTDVVRTFVRNIVTEWGVIFGFVVTFTTHELWPVVVLGVWGMLSSFAAMRTNAPPPEE